MLVLIVLINSFIKICNIIPFYLFVVVSRIRIVLICRSCDQTRARCCWTKSRYLTEEQKNQIIKEDEKHTFVVNALCILSCTFGTIFVVFCAQSPGPGNELSGSPTLRSFVLWNGAVLFQSKINKNIKYVLTHLQRDQTMIYSPYHRFLVPFMANSESSRTLFFCRPVAS